MTRAIVLVRRLTWKRGTRWNKEISKVAIGRTRRASSRSIIFCSQYYPQIWLWITCVPNELERQVLTVCISSSTGATGRYMLPAWLFSLLKMRANRAFLGRKNARRCVSNLKVSCTTLARVEYDVVCIVNMHTMLSHSTRGGVLQPSKDWCLSPATKSMHTPSTSSMHIYAFHAYYTSSTTRLCIRS